jgi:hypothetical protein
MITVKEAVKDTTARFSHAIAGVLYYNLYVGEDIYQFSIDMNDKDDVGTATFVNEYRGITLMRYIRKAINSENFVKISR